MVRTDGKYQIFKIEHQWNGSAKWSSSIENVSEFPPTSDCWQQTGVHGTFDLEEAKDSFKKIVSIPNEVRKFRLVRVTIEQVKEEIEM